jgi:hypothetical protein
MLFLCLDEEYLDSSIYHVYLCTGFSSIKNGFHSVRSQKTKEGCYFGFVKRSMAIYAKVKSSFYLSSKYNTLKYELVKKKIARVL